MNIEEMISGKSFYLYSVGNDDEGIPNITFRSSDDVYVVCYYDEQDANVVTEYSFNDIKEDFQMVVIRYGTNDYDPYLDEDNE